MADKDASIGVVPVSEETKPEEQEKVVVTPPRSLRDVFLPPLRSRISRFWETETSEPLLHEDKKEEG